MTGSAFIDVAMHHNQRCIHVCFVYFLEFLDLWTGVHGGLVFGNGSSKGCGSGAPPSHCGLLVVRTAFYRTPSSSRPHVTSHGSDPRRGLLGSFPLKYGSTEPLRDVARATAVVGGVFCRRGSHLSDSLSSMASKALR